MVIRKIVKKLSRIGIYLHLKHQQEKFDISRTQNYQDSMLLRWEMRTEGERRRFIEQENATTFFFSPGKLEYFLGQHKADDIDPEAIRNKIIKSKAIIMKDVFV